MLRIGLLLFTMIYSCAISAQQFPEMETQNVETETVVLPEDFAGKKTILFLAFTAEAEQQLDNWYAPVYTLFLDQSGFNAMAYDCHVKLVMMFTGPAQAAADKVIEKMSENVADDMKDYLLFYQGNFKDEMKELELQKKDDCYVLVLDEKGKVIYNEKGNYSEKKLESIAKLVEL